MKQLTFITIITISLFITGCKKEDNTGNSNTNNNGTISDNLHFSFYTPDWNAVVNCEQLVLDATSDSLLRSTSASTNETFYLTVPKDSSLWSLPSNITTFPIGLQGTFTFNQTLPITQGSSIRLIGMEQPVSDNSFHKINSITYDHSDNTGAYFKIKANYKMVMKVLYSSSMDTLKNVYGDYTFIVKTNKK